MSLLTSLKSRRWSASRSRRVLLAKSSVVAQLLLSAAVQAAVRAAPARPPGRRADLRRSRPRSCLMPPPKLRHAVTIDLRHPAAPLAQWKSSGLLIRWFRVRAPGGAPRLAVRQRCQPGHEPRGRRPIEQQMSDGFTHLDRVDDVAPSGDGCEDFLRIGRHWLHLRMCMSCGHIGCCDDSPNRHATRTLPRRHPPAHLVVRRIVVRPPMSKDRVFSSRSEHAR
jgi:hypothetical protein